MCGTLVVFAKQPEPGQVKTRLAAEVGSQIAAELYEAMLRDVLEEIASAFSSCVLAYAPETETANRFFDGLRRPADQLWPQPGGSLSERLIAAARLGTDRGGPVVIIGSDSPLVAAAQVQQAFSRLEETDVVLIPTADGGYALIGMASFRPELLTGISWSTDRVLAQTLSRAESGRLSYSLLEATYDIDTLDDVRRLHQELFASGSPVRNRPWRTAAVIGPLFDGNGQYVERSPG